jgi:putative transposase
MISLSGTHILKDVIFHAVFFYLRYAVSYRDLEEIRKNVARQLIMQR